MERVAVSCEASRSDKKRGPLRNLPCIPKWEKCEPRMAEWVVFVYEQYKLQMDNFETVAGNKLDI